MPPKIVGTRYITPERIRYEVIVGATSEGKASRRAVNYIRLYIDHSPLGRRGGNITVERVEILTRRPKFNRYLVTLVYELPPGLAPRRWIGPFRRI